MIVLPLLSEIITSALALISPVVSNKIIPIFIFIGIIKAILLITFDLDKDYKTVITLNYVSFVYYIGIILKLVLNIPTSQLYKEAILGVVGIIVGSIISKLLYSYEHLIMNAKLYKIIIGGAILLAIFAFVYKLFMIPNEDGEPLGDGSIAIGNFTLQLPEIIKILLILATFIASVLMHKGKSHIWLMYISSGIFCALVGFYFKEKGTPLVVVYFTLAMGISLGSNQKYKDKCKNQVLDFLNSEKFTYLLGIMFFFIIKILKNILYKKYPLRGEIGEKVYKSKKWFYISQRLWADATQTVEARNILRNAPLIPLNLNFDVQIPYCKKMETAISDYCIVVLSLGLGKIIATFLIIIMVALLIFTFIKSDYLGKAASTMLISQIAVQVSGIIGFGFFTGVNLPFISAGASSAFSSCVLVTFIIYSMRRNNNA